MSEVIATSEADALLAFDAEGSSIRPSRPAPPARTPPPLAPIAAPPRQRVRPTAAHAAVAVAAIALALGAAATFWLMRGDRSALPAGAPTGSVTITSQPEGAEVVVDGEVRGTTPLELALAGGSHQLELRREGSSRAIPLVVEAGTSSTHYIDMGAAVPSSTGSLEVTSDPPGAEVRVDGALSGRTPIVLQSVAPGEHRVSITTGDGTITRTVEVAAGATASVVATSSPAAPAAGWVSIRAPFELQISEQGRLLGTTDADRLMLPAGRHSLDLSNSALEFRQTITVQVAPGRTASSTVSVPNGSISINALPWADVWIDGRSVGTTPLGNLSVPVGIHEIVWRHPELGERRRSIPVTARAPVRIGVDFNQ